MNMGAIIIDVIKMAKIDRFNLKAGTLYAENTNGSTIKL